MEEENIQKPVRKTGKMRKLERKIANLTEKNQMEPKESITKKITKLEKKKAKLEKWLHIKLPFRFLIKLGTTWLVIGGVCYGCSYVPVVKEIKSAITAAVAYMAPEEVGQAMDIVTLNFGVSKQDFEWLKTTLKAYISGEIQIEFAGESNPDYAERSNQIAEEVLGTKDFSNLSIPDILGKIATNATADMVAELLDMANLTEESRVRLEQDLNRALKILPKLNNSQMNEIVDILNGLDEGDDANNKAREQLQLACQSFVEEIRTTGVISYHSYQKVSTQIQELGISEKLEIKVQALDTGEHGQNAGTQRIGENQYNTIDSSQIIGQLQSGNYVLSVGDIVTVSIRKYCTTFRNGANKRKIKRKWERLQFT